jgi:hypothetical protein
VQRSLAASRIVIPSKAAVWGKMHAFLAIGIAAADGFKRRVPCLPAKFARSARS